MQKLIVLTPPAAEPVTLGEMKQHLRLSSDAEDEVITALLTTARVAAENFTGAAFITQDLRLLLDRAPPQLLELPRTPVSAVTAVTVDGLAVEAYTVDLPTARLDLRGLPQPLAAMAGIHIDFTAGYGAEAAAVPPPLRQGIRQLAARLFENRGEGVDTALTLSGAASLLQPYRRMRLA